MLFNSLGYLLFLLIAVPTNWLLPARHRTYALSAFSLLFYAMWRWDFTLLVVFSAVVDFTAAGRIHAHTDPRMRRAWLALSLCTNLGLLLVFKYAYFLSDSFADMGSLFGYQGNGIRDLGWDIILPLGISFYTFQTISYSIDVYRRVAEPEARFIDFLTYVTFWPQLIAGPILRASEVIPQLKVEHHPDAENFNRGLIRVMIGLCKKIVIADGISSLVDSAFALDPTAMTAPDVWVAAMLFGFQIYFDFSGYSDIAIGSARMLGIRFPNNFDWPYLARSPRDFWQRWHISLSSWIRDYLYLPLTGQQFQTRSTGGIGSVSTSEDESTDTVEDRPAASRSRRNGALLLTWFIMGLWHGAAWTFAIWGVYHALLILLFRSFESLKTLEDRIPILGWAITFPIVMIGWIPFRATSVEQTLLMWGRVLDPTAYGLAGRTLVGHAYMYTVLLSLGMIVSFFGLRWLEPRVGKLRGPLLAASVAGMTLLLLALLRPISQFIYFQF